MIKKIIIKSSLILAFLCFLSSLSASQSNFDKYSLWKNKSFLRGFNVIVSQNLTQKDFDDLKAIGATIAHLNVYGFLDTMPPYQFVQKHLDDIDKLVEFCRNAHIYYTFTVRQGPGRRDVYWEGEKLVTKSSIWINPQEQQLYAGMIKDMVARYSNDSLFIGISPILEPNPLFDTLYFTPEMLKQMLIEKNIDVNSIYNIIIDSIRKVNKTIPILVQNVAYSCPEFFKIMEPLDDNYLVYEFHNYRPSEYVNETTPNRRTYPGKYVSINNLNIEYHDSSFFQNNIFKYVKEFELKTKAPIFLGEFGLLTEQIGGILFVQDVSNICIQNGWHFAYWIWRGGSGWDFEKMDKGYIEKIKELFAKWSDVLNDFDKSKTPNIYYNLNNDDEVLYIFSSINSTISLYNFSGKLIDSFNSADNSTITYNIQNLPVGLYFVVLNANNHIFTKFFFKC